MTAPALPAWAERLKRRTAGGLENCQSMVRYRAEHQARRAGQVLLSHGGHPGHAPTARLWPFACPHCRGWHLTRLPGRGAPVTADALHEGVVFQ